MVVDIKVQKSLLWPKKMQKLSTTALFLLLYAKKDRKYVQTRCLRWFPEIANVETPAVVDIILIFQRTFQFIQNQRASSILSHEQYAMVEKLNS